MSWLSATINTLSQRVSRDFEAAFRHALMSRSDLIEELWIKKQEKFLQSARNIRLNCGGKENGNYFSKKCF